MTGFTLKRDYDLSQNKTHYIFLCSDLHIDSPAHDRELLKQELDMAMEVNADILIGGDVFDAILHTDRKRYSPSGDIIGTDQKLNVIVQKAYEFLKPYAKNIVAIGHGNHETSVMKFNSFDPIDALVYLLSTDSEVDIKKMHYTGIVRYSYEHLSGGNRKSFDIYFNHGQGGNAEISKGLIMVDRHKKKVHADIYWFGHIHQKVILPSENVIYMDANGVLKSKVTRCIITGCYNRVFYDSSDKDYASVNFGEERMRVNQATGGAMLKVTHLKSGYDIKIEV